MWGAWHVVHAPCMKILKITIINLGTGKSRRGARIVREGRGRAQEPLARVNHVATSQVGGTGSIPLTQ